jgi:glycosyltransferase involved in cell wall biosynthesis
MPPGRGHSGMRIGVNLIPLRPGQMGGLEFYVRSLLSHLLAVDAHSHYFLFTAWWNHQALDFPQGRYQKILAVSESANADPPLEGGTKGSGPWGVLPRLPLLRKIASTRPADLHSWARDLKLDLWFCPMINLDPRQLPLPTVVTIPDIQQEYYPEFFTQAELSQRALMYKPSCEDATAVITISNYSKEDMIARYGLPPEKVHCTYLAGGMMSSPSATGPSTETVRQPHRLPQRFALYPANMWPHKNHHMLVLALHRLRKTYGVTLPLVLTGDDLGQWTKLQEVIAHFHLQEAVHYLGYVPSAEVGTLYAKATLLVFPSLFEGFGIPLVEAMALECPIAAANRTSIPEVVGDAALLFDPRNPDSIAEAMYRILSDEPLRQSLIARGRGRRALFSWQETASQTLRVFEWAHSRHTSVQRATPPRRIALTGVYPDGWATRKVRLEFPATLPYLEEVEAVKLEGFSNYLTYPLTLRLRINGRRASEVVVKGPGSFAVVGALRTLWTVPSRMTIEFSANRDFIPEQAVLGPDPRSLAYVIERLSLICRSGEEVQLYARSSSQGAG